jgi:hypothetical protein
MSTLAGGMKMKIKLTFKNPTAIEAAIEDATFEIVDDDEMESMADEIDTACRKWLRYGEYVDIEIDTENNTCNVIQPSQEE